MAMASLGLWIAELATSRRSEAKTPLREWHVSNREAPSGLCLVAGITWFASMAVPTIAAVFLLPPWRPLASISAGGDGCLP